MNSSNLQRPRYIYIKVLSKVTLIQMKTSTRMVRIPSVPSSRTKLTSKAVYIAGEMWLAHSPLRSFLSEAKGRYLGM